MLESYFRRWVHVSALVTLNQLRIENGRVILTECMFPTESELVELLERKDRGIKYRAYLADQRRKLEAKK